MPRAVGQIDRIKSEAILKAAGRILAEQGFGAPMSAIAREAGVSKQTIYNHFGAKTDLVRALVNRRVTEATAPLDAPGAAEHPHETLQAFARVLINRAARPGAYAIMRLIIQSSSEMPDLARDVYEVGPRAMRGRLAKFLEMETKAGRLQCDDAAEAADLFTGMAVGNRQLSALIGMPSDRDEPRRERFPGTVADRFMRAFCPCPTRNRL